MQFKEITALVTMAPLGTGTLLETTCQYSVTPTAWLVKGPWAPRLSALHSHAVFHQPPGCYPSPVVETWSTN